MLQLHRFHKGKWLLLDVIRQFQIHKRYLPAVSKLCKCIPRTQSAIRECGLLYLFLPLSAKTVLSKDFPSRNGKQYISLRKCKYLMTPEVQKLGKIPPCALPSCWRLQVYQVHLAKCSFLFRTQVLGSEKHFPTASELYKDTPRTHCTIPLEESSGKHVLWELLPYLLLPWEGGITLPGDCSVTKQELLLSENTDI